MDLDYARRQQDAAIHGEADGQCSCGSYRADGLPPVLHYDGCTEPQMDPALWLAQFEAIEHL